jgi:hypothetical protein
LCIWLSRHWAFSTPSKKDRIFSFLSLKVIGELFGDFVIVADAVSTNPELVEETEV